MSLSLLICIMICVCVIGYAQSVVMTRTGIVLVSNHNNVIQFVTDRTFVILFALVVPIVSVVIQFLLSQIDFLLFAFLLVLPLVSVVISCRRLFNYPAPLN